nr:GrpB family protein [Catenulispora pinistramenti]
MAGSGARARGTGRARAERPARRCRAHRLHIGPRIGRQADHRCAGRLRARRHRSSRGSLTRARIRAPGADRRTGREYLRRRSAVPANATVVERRGRIWTANIRFRDHLRTKPDAAARYALAKQQAAEATGMLTAYSELKAAIVAELMDEAGQ